MDEQLLIRFLSHRCTPQEVSEVEHWAALDAANAAWLFEIERVWSLKNELRFSRKERIEAAYRRFTASRTLLAPGSGAGTSSSVPSGRCAPATSTPHTKTHFLFTSLRYAAAVVLIALLSFHFYQMRHEIPAGKNTVEVPPGEKALLTLSDGTHVWLNAGSRFTYPAAFTAANREVELVGEGFFEVTHNSHAPFRVHTPQMEIKVLGTKFNLKAYSGEISRVTLTEGAVEVTAGKGEKLRLKPNEQASYSAGEGLRLAKKVDPALASGWRDGELVFTREYLANIVRELQRKFDVPICIDDPALGKERFNCRVAPGTSALQVLDLLKKTRGLDYRLQNDTIRIFKKQRPMK